MIQYKLTLKNYEECFILPTQILIKSRIGYGVWFSKWII